MIFSSLLRVPIISQIDDVFSGGGTGEEEDMCHNTITGRDIDLDPFVYYIYVI